MDITKFCLFFLLVFSSEKQKSNAAVCRRTSADSLYIQKTSSECDCEHVCLCHIASEHCYHRLQTSLVDLILKPATNCTDLLSNNEPHTPYDCSDSTNHTNCFYKLKFSYLSFRFEVCSTFKKELIGMWIWGLQGRKVHLWCHPFSLLNILKSPGPSCPNIIPERDKPEELTVHVNITVISDEQYSTKYKKQSSTESTTKKYATLKNESYSTKTTAKKISRKMKSTTKRYRTSEISKSSTKQTTKFFSTKNISKIKSTTKRYGTSEITSSSNKHKTKRISTKISSKMTSASSKYTLPQDHSSSKLFICPTGGKENIGAFAGGVAVGAVAVVVGMCAHRLFFHRLHRVNPEQQNSVKENDDFLKNKPRNRITGLMKFCFRRLKTKLKIPLYEGSATFSVRSVATSTDSQASTSYVLPMSDEDHHIEEMFSIYPTTLKTLTKKAFIAGISEARAEHVKDNTKNMQIVQLPKKQNTSVPNDSPLSKSFSNLSPLEQLGKVRTTVFNMLFNEDEDDEDEDDD